MPEDPTQYMTCMEVWGGNQPANNGVIMPGLDAWIYSLPFGDSDSGGDVYYVSACATGRITRLLLADVSGHGTQVSKIAVSLRKLMQKYVNFIDQTAFVGSMNRQFAELAGAGTFATAIVSTFFGPTNDLTLCIAGHPPPLLYRAASKRWTILDHQEGTAAGNIPLGIDDAANWTQFDVRLRVGDLVLAYTDSLIEAFGADGEMLCPKGLLQIINTVDVSDPKRVIPLLLEKMAVLNDKNLKNDDVTALLFRPNGTAPGVKLKDKLLGPLRVMGGVFGSLKPGGKPAPWPEFSLANVGGMIFRPLNRLWSARSATSSRPAPPGAPAP
jgi:hypothetical protein